MSENDILSLESNFKNWRDEREIELTDIDPFEYYCIEHFMKSYDPSDEELLSGLVGGGMDGGVDGIYFAVNGELVQEDSELSKRGDSKVNLIIFQVKDRKGGFSPIELGKWASFTEDLLDLSRPASSFTATYKAELIELMRIFKEKYSQILGTFPKCTVDYYYITKGDEAEPDPSANAAADKVKAQVIRHLRDAKCEVHFINAQRLLEQVRRLPPKERTLVWSESPMHLKEGHVGLVKLRDLYEFIQDEGGARDDSIFDANVRGFLKDSDVNKQIRESLGSSESTNFWLLNNGVTIIATRSQPAHLKLTLEAPQIVNGLQTSREIFSHFSKGPHPEDNRSILVKVVVTSDDVVQDKVVRATNSQNRMQAASLRATNVIQHKIEDVFKQYGLFYDRRKGRYRDQGKSIKKIVSMTELLQAALSILIQRPDDARGRPSDYVKDDDKYDLIFDEDKYPLSVYVTCVQVMRRVSDFINKLPIERTEKIDVKFYVATLLVCRITEEAETSPEKVLEIDASTIDESLLGDSYKRVSKIYKELVVENPSVARGPDLLRRLKTHIRKSLAAKKGTA